MANQTSRSTRIRYTATGAVAALAAVGAIAGAIALGATPPAKAPDHIVAGNSAVKTAPNPNAPAPAGQVKTPTAQPSPSPQPFLNAVERLVDNGTITAAEGQVVDREIQTGQVDTQTLASSGFSSAQLAAVQQALSGAKQALAQNGTHNGK